MAVTPQLTPIKDGWAAFGEGWTVHGATKDEALRKFREAEERYRQIDARSEPQCGERRQSEA